MNNHNFNFDGFHICIINVISVFGNRFKFPNTISIRIRLEQHNIISIVYGKTNTYGQGGRKLPKSVGSIVRR